MTKLYRFCSIVLSGITTALLIITSIGSIALLAGHYASNQTWFGGWSSSNDLNWLDSLASIAIYSLIYYLGPIVLAVCAAVFLFWVLAGQTRKYSLSIGKLVGLTMLVPTVAVIGAYHQDTVTWQTPNGLGGHLGEQLLVVLAQLGKLTRLDTIPINYLSWLLYATAFIALVATTTGFGNSRIFRFLLKFFYLPGYWFYLAKLSLDKIFGRGPRTSDAQVPSNGESAEQNKEAEEINGQANGVKTPLLFGSSKRIVLSKSEKAPSNSSEYMPPGLRLLRQSGYKGKVSNEELTETSEKIKQGLADFGITGEITDIQCGPVISIYEFRPVAGTKVAQIATLEDDLARVLGTESVRVVNLPKKNAIGIELPNREKQTIYARELFSRADFLDGNSLKLVAGKTAAGDPLYLELNKLPHLLIAGATGSGKSVAVNLMLMSLLYRFSPQECKLILVDPKRLELSVYRDIPHLLAPVVTDPKKAVLVLRWVVRQMELRHERMVSLGVRNINSYNERIKIAEKTGRTLSYRTSSGDKLPLEFMPYIVVVVDEMADLMMLAGRDIEAVIQRLTQMARAAGIHLIVATQRPSVDVITGTIKANFPARISFRVSSVVDSRTILGQSGAEHLLGSGDMLLMQGAGNTVRAHSAYIAEEEIEAVNKYLRNNYKAQYECDFNSEKPEQLQSSVNGNNRDELYGEALALVAEQHKCSVSLVQRRFQIGYNRAARIVDDLEENGVVSAADHVGRRKVLIK